MTAFSRITEEHELILIQLSPCARLLYRWLLRLRPAGTPVEIELDEFIGFTALGRARAYCLKHVKRALADLLGTELVDEVKRYSARVFKLVAWHPDRTKTSSDRTKMSQHWTKMSKKEASNPDSVVPITENLETTEQDAAVENEQEKVDPALQAEVEAIGIQMNPQLAATILQYGLERVKSAIALVRERRKNSKVKNPAGLLTAAIKQGWKSSSVNSEVDHRSGDASLPSEFNEWYGLAYKLGIVRASQFIDGVLCVYTNLDEWEPYSALSVAFSLQKLREIPC